MRDSLKQDASRRLARISGQVNGLQKMVDDDRYCVDVLTQVAALRAALDQFGVLMLTTHLEDCVYGGDSDSHGSYAGLTNEQRVEEIRTTLNRFLK
ncbi:MAG: metal-sensitive transcriptional regulator [Fimbriimonas sp.]